MREMRSMTGTAGAAGGHAAGLDDPELVRRVRAGDRSAFAALVRQHGGALLRFARVFVRDEAVAEEVVQDTWMAALEGLDGFEGRASFKTWLYRILANRARVRARFERGGASRSRRSREGRTTSLRWIPSGSTSGGCGATRQWVGRTKRRSGWRSRPRPAR